LTSRFSEARAPGQIQAPASWSTARQSLDALLAETIAAGASTIGYAVKTVAFGESFEVTLEKGGSGFVVWVRPAIDDTPCDRQTIRFKVGHRGEPIDRSGYTLLDALCAAIEAWERKLHSGATMQVFDGTPFPSVTEQAGPDAVTAQLLSAATFTPIYRDWLKDREGELATYFQRRSVRAKKNVLLVNATKGLQFYASIADFFALLQRTHAGIRVTSASYFEEIIEFQQGVADKGLQIVSVTDVESWDAAALNRFDVIVLIGASDALVTFMARNGLTAKLVLLDLGFFHQLLDAHPGWLPGTNDPRRRKIIADESLQKNRVVVYSCQPQDKVVRDFTGVCAPQLLEWRWINYIPIGFTYSTYYRADRSAFDVGLLGSAGRRYEEIDARLFAGRRFLFLGPENVPEIEHLRAQLDVTVVSRVDEETYARLLALCRCVVLPYHGRYAQNVFMSVTDAAASGKPLVTTRQAGVARLEQDGLPLVFYDTSVGDLFRQVDSLLGHDGRLGEIEARSIAFAREKLDIYRILEAILDEQVL
jgi:glycosyltransferase involved in cell wall biosynthesis